MKCKFYSEETGKCLFDEAPDDCIFCGYFKLIEYEKESSPYNLNSTEINVFSKLVKEYIKDQDKLDKVVETFESYLSNSSKSPANAEGKCSDEGTFYRVMKGRIENKEESEDMMRCKYYSDYESGQHDFGVCHYEEVKGGFPMICTHKDKEKNCTCFELIEESKKESKNMVKCKYYAETARRGWCSNVDCLLERCSDFNNCDCSESAVCKEEPEVVNAKLMTDINTCMDPRTLTIQNCDKIILKPKSLEVEVKIEKDNFDDFDYIVINGHRFKKV